MNLVRSALKSAYKQFIGDSLYRNSISLIGSTAAIALFGFFFWILAAHFYSTNDVGLVAALVAISNVVMTLSLLGFDNSFIRYLPKSKSQNEQLNTGFTISTIASLILGCGYLLAIRLFIPELGFVATSMVWAISFVFFMAINMLNYLSNYPFVAVRASHVVLIINTCFGAVRLLALVLLAPLGMKGLVLSHVMATILALLATFIVMWRRLDYVPKLQINIREFRKIAGYTFHSYFSVVFLMLPIHLLPSIVVGRLGASSSAYYYIVAIIVAALNVIPMATSQSLFAEGVWSEKKLREHIFKAVKVISYLMAPSIVILMLGGKYILSLFGHDYVSGGYYLLILMVLASIPKVFSYLLSTILRIEHRVGTVALIYGLTAALLLIGSYVGLKLGHGLVSIGWASLVSEIISMILFVLTYSRFKKQLTANKQAIV